MKPLVEKANAIDSAMTEVEKELYQTKNRSGQDPLNFPIKLTNKLAHVGTLTARGQFAPTQQAVQVKEELTEEINTQLDKFEQIRNTELPEFNRMVREKAVDAIKLTKEAETDS